MARSLGVDPRIGTELAGHRIEALLGRGGMSVVYLAEQTRLKRRVALKLLAPELAEDERFRERFLRESELAASIDHPNIIPIYDAAETDGLLYIAMRYVEGTDLKRLLREEGALQPGRALGLVGQVAEALDVAHERGLVHRDVKPANVLIASRGGREHCYLSDFGLTKQTSSDSGLTETGQFMGTADYVAPEQIERGPVDARSDVYSLGCLLFECLTGEAPFRSDSLMATLWGHLNSPPPLVSERSPELPPGLDTVVARAMAKSPGERYGACRELVQDARAALGVSVEPEVVPAPARRRLPLVLTVVAVLVLAGAIVAGILLARGGAEGILPITVDSLVRIDPATNELVAATPVGSNPSYVAAGLGAVWVVSYDEQTVFRIDTTTNTVSATIPTRGLRPGGISVGRDAVVVSAFDPQSPPLVRGGVLFRIFPKTNTANPSGFEDRYEPLGFGDGFLWATTSRGSTQGGVGTLTRIEIDQSILRVLETIGVGRDPLGLAVGEGAVWITDAQLPIVSRIDAAGREVAATVPLRFVSLSPVGIAAGEGGVWVTDNRGDSVAEVDPATNRVVKTIEVGNGPLGVTVGAGSVWVANHNDGTVSRIDPKTGKVVATIDVGPNPIALAADAGGVWVTVNAP